MLQNMKIGRFGEKWRYGREKRGDGEKSEKLPKKIEKYRKRKPFSPLLYIIYRKKTAI